MAKFWSLIRLFSFTLLLAACSAPPEASLVGAYQAEFDFGVEMLLLRPDGSYEQQLAVTATGETVSHRGSWTYDQTRSKLTLLDPLQFDNNFGKLNPEFRTPVSGEWRLDVRRRIGSTSLAWNDDLGVEFRMKR